MDKNKIRYIIGILCIIGSFGGMSSGQPLPSIFMLLFGVSLLPIIYEKIDFSKIKNANIVIPIVIFIIFIIAIASFGNTEESSNVSNNENVVNEFNTELKNNNDSITNIENSDNNTKFVLDVPSFNNITYNQMIEKMGEPTDTDTYSVGGKTAQIYLYDEKYECMFYNNKLIRITICAYQFEELKNLNNINDFCKNLNITEYSTSSKSADTGYALRFKNLTNDIKDFWITGLNDPEYIQIKITFESNDFDI